MYQKARKRNVRSILSLIRTFPTLGINKMKRRKTDLKGLKNNNQKVKHFKP